MADANSAAVAGGAEGLSSGRSPLSPEGLLRYRLARSVVIGTFLAIFALVFALLVVAQQGNTVVQNVADKTFNIVLPVLAAWMGTVLAFYFSAQTQERTSASLERLVSQTTATPPGATVSQAMIEFASIRHPYDTAQTAPGAIPLAELKQKLVPPVTRLMFHENGVFKHVLHVGTLDGFMLANPTASTLADLLADAQARKQISELVAFTRRSATLDEAKAALEAVPGAQDIIVTETGAPTGRMVGWLTNIDLTKKLSTRS